MARVIKRGVEFLKLDTLCYSRLTSKLLGALFFLIGFDTVCLFVRRFVGFHLIAL